MAVEVYELTVFTDALGRRCVRLPACPDGSNGAGGANDAPNCAACGARGACAGGGGKRAPATLPLDNATQLSGVPDGARLKVTVERMNPALLAAVLFLAPLALLAAGGIVGVYFWGQNPGLLVGTTAGMLAAWGWLRQSQRRWCPLRARGEPMPE